MATRMTLKALAVATALAAGGLAHAEGTITTDYPAEKEANNVSAIADTLKPMVITVTGTLGDKAENSDYFSNQDVDIFKFTGEKNQSLTVVLTSAAGCPPAPAICTGGSTGPNPVVQLFDKDGTLVTSSTLEDNGAKKIDVTLNSTGTYYLVVTDSNRQFSSIDVLKPFQKNHFDGKSTYTMKVNKAATITTVGIEVRPGSDDLAQMNPKSHGRVPVAILGRRDFDPMTVYADVEGEHALTFGIKGNEQSLAKCDDYGQDVNGDGILDRVCHFYNDALDLDSVDAETTTGVINGWYKQKGDDGAEHDAQFTGSSDLKMLPLGVVITHGKK